MSTTLSDVIDALVIANHILAHEGVVDAFGHVSVRHPEADDRYLLSCSRSPAQVAASDIMTFSLDGEVIGVDARKPYLERFIHGAIYEARPDVTAVIHSHAHAVIPFGVTNTPIRPLIHIAGALGAEVPVWDIATDFGDTSLLVTTMQQARSLARTLGDRRAALMRGHGAVVAAGSLRDSVLLAISLQTNAALDLQSRQLGNVKYLSAGEIALTPEALLSAGPANRAWEYFAGRAAQKD